MTKTFKTTTHKSIINNKKLLEFIITRNQANRKSNRGKNWACTEFLRLPFAKHRFICEKSKIDAKIGERPLLVGVFFSNRNENASEDPSEAESRSLSDISDAGKIALVKCRLVKCRKITKSPVLQLHCKQE